MVGGPLSEVEFAARYSATRPRGARRPEHERLRDSDPLTPSNEDALTEEELAQGASEYNEQATSARAVSAAKSKRGRCACCTLIILVVVLLNIIIPCLKVYKQRHPDPNPTPNPNVNLTLTPTLTRSTSSGTASSGPRARTISSSGRSYLRPPAACI